VRVPGLPRLSDEDLSALAQILRNWGIDARR